MRSRRTAKLAMVVALALATLPTWVIRAPGQGNPTDTAEVHLARGHEALKQNRYREAGREFRAALALDPRLTVRARFPLAVTLFNLQEREQARKEFEAVRAQTGDDPNLNYYLGRLDLMEGNLDSAVRNLTVAASDPPFTDTDYYLGYAYLKKHELASAEKWLSRAAGSAPRDARTRERLGLLYQAMGREEDAEKAFALARQFHQEDVVATEQALACGRSLDTQTLAQAKEVCQKLLDPDDVGKLTSLGMLYGEHGDYALAVEPFRLAAEVDPDSYEGQYNLGLTYFRLKRYADARGPLEKAVALRPDTFEVNAPLGAVLYALGDDEDAYRVLDHADRLNPANGDVSRLLCLSALSLAGQSLQRNEAVRARDYLLRAVEASPADPEPHRKLAAVYQLLGDHAAAQRERDEASRLGPH